MRQRTSQGQAGQGHAGQGHAGQGHAGQGHAGQGHAGDQGGESLTLADAAYRRLRHDIVAGVFEAGSPLRLEMLRNRYGFSFSPLREALNRLQSERLVTSVALRGFSVAPFSSSEMWDAIETRILVEREAMRRSIANGGDVWEATIVAAFHTLMLKSERSASLPGDGEALEASHRDFHRALIGECGSPRLLDLADHLYMETERYRRPALIGTAAGRPARAIVKEHREIMDAVLARRSTAGELLAEHYRRTGRLVEKGLQLEAA